MKNLFGFYFKNNFTERVQEIIQTLILSERYEAVSPMARLIIPIYEQLESWQVLKETIKFTRMHSKCLDTRGNLRRNTAGMFQSGWN